MRAGYDGLAILMTTATTYTVTSIGGPLAKMLPRSGRWGTVFAVFQRSCYLERQDGQVFCLADHMLGQGPLTLNVRFPENTTLSSLGVREGSQLEADGVDLRMGHALALRTDETTVWEPEALGQIAPPEEILRRLDALINLMQPLMPSSGLAGIIPHIAGIASEEPLPISRMSGTTAIAMPRLRRLSKGLANSSPELVDEAVAGLLGLGPGLTPSGDDLLGGLMVALRAMPDTTSHLSVAMLSGSIAKQAARKTTRISTAMLEQSVIGYGSAAQHRLLHCLLAVDGRFGTIRAAMDLVRTGHTSGWDALAGISLGIHFGLRTKRDHEFSELHHQDETAGIPA